MLMVRECSLPTITANDFYRRTSLPTMDVYSGDVYVYNLMYNQAEQ